MLIKERNKKMIHLKGHVRERMDVGERKEWKIVREKDKETKLCQTVRVVFLSALIG